MIPASDNRLIELDFPVAKSAKAGTDPWAYRKRNPATDGVLATYAKLVSSAHLGAVTDGGL